MTFHNEPTYSELAREALAGTDTEAFILEEEDREARWEALEEDFQEGRVG